MNGREAPESEHRLNPSNAPGADIDARLGKQDLEVGMSNILFLTGRRAGYSGAFAGQAGGGGIAELRSEGSAHGFEAGDKVVGLSRGSSSN